MTASGVKASGLQVLHHEPLARYTSWRVGGPADRLVLADSVQHLQQFLQQLSASEPLTFIGLGSNLLVRDGGVRGTVVVMHQALQALEMQGERIYADAGVTCAKLARFAASQNRAGAEFMAGIPGTVGGALAMNAGCYGGETWQWVDQLKTIDRNGKVQVRNKAEYQPVYRHVTHPVADEWFLGGWFTVPAGDGKASAEQIKQLLAKRLASQPLNMPSAGSTFRNPEGDFAARLIEASGLKGTTIGGAQVSEKHANFIVNLGSASAADIEALIEHVKTTVRAKQGVALVQEVKVIGEGVLKA
ncbi:UDP-N-acetylmuramate dehydrogenase [Methylophilus rhizosphaerae]|uniref:UDP-N-acetylenolpyruvoylglucosamine reductase n=1 Tax=Methylophilus rhizosphaerae TaxID=492660 RepID=A0A1G9CWK1_9PROT|nr:UDP-N-acetylmuramate dehydrogenase [Methylophilus rhizosphaerae]SDK56027.1 UDP-N-acetylmuramate dehydrogenase [Methylophilus rhizosphaerae]